MKLTESNTRELFEKLKLKAIKSFNKGKINYCLRMIKAASHTAYSFYLEFKDDEIENLLNKISYSLKKSESLIKLKSNKCAFYDSFCLDNKGLTQQYIRAIINAGWDLLYITDSIRNGFTSEDIIFEINHYYKSTIVEIPPYLHDLKRSQFIYDTITAFAPSRLFMHISPSAVYAITAFYALPKSIEKFLINITDHSFWIGRGCLDYSIEFRAYGASLSINKREISRDNVFIIPYYPIIKQTKFQGLPVQCEKKIIVLSGGAYYKVIDNENTFFKLISSILDMSENVVILYAGGGDSLIFSKFIKDNNYEDRLLLLGYRKDICEVYKRSDIYLNTYPIIGGLMCQYAAYNSKPILSYSSKNLSKAEDVVCQKKYEEISYFNFNDFKAEARRLINNGDYREFKGTRLKECVVDESDFNDIFLKTINNKRNQINFLLNKKINDNDLKGKLKYENISNDFKLNLFKAIGLKSIIECPFLFYDVIKIIVLQKKYYIILLRRFFRIWR